MNSAHLANISSLEGKESAAIFIMWYAVNMSLVKRNNHHRRVLKDSE